MRKSCSPRPLLIALLLPALACCCALLPGTGEAAATVESSADGFAGVTPGLALQFPRDRGSHPAFRTEWWYVTGWIETDAHETLGFQITFFRTRPALQDANPSTFAARELLLAHCALSDPRHGRLWHDQRIRRAGLGLAAADESDTRVWIDDWRLERVAGEYLASLAAADFTLALHLKPTQPPLLNGDSGFSRKGPALRSASYYYSEPHLLVTGTVKRSDAPRVVHGEAWLDHEWSSDYLASDAVGWDWIGINLDDGGAIMAFRLRDRSGGTYWSGATLRDRAGVVHTLSGESIRFAPQRYWQSPRSAVRYPVTLSVELGERRLELAPLMEDQENDARLSSGAIYWEGAVTAFENDRAIGHGYLELTGYDSPLKLGR
jgi:predicted secreted hydrolase